MKSLNVTGSLRDRAVQELKLDFDIFPSNGSSQPVNSVTHHQRYNVTAYLNTEDSLQSERLVVGKTVILHAPERVEDEVLEHFQLNATFDLTEVSCSKNLYNWLCVELQPSEEAAKVWYQSDAVKFKCSNITCTGKFLVDANALCLMKPFTCKWCLLNSREKYQADSELISHTQTYCQALITGC